MSAAERAIKRRERNRHTFSDAAYQHFDPLTSGGFGSPDEWGRIADDMASGRHTLHGYQEPRGGNPDLTMLGLDRMPLGVQMLKSTFRARVFATHPDRGGNAAEFKKVVAAYERLLKFY